MTARIVLFFVLAVLIAWPAAALDIGECGTMEAMQAKLKAAGQQSIAYAAANADKGVTATAALRGIVFSVNADGSTGYTLQTNAPIGRNPSQMCVYNRMTNVRVYDVRREGPQAGVRMSTSEGEATTKCMEILRAGHAKECRVLNAMIDRAAAIGERVMIVGDTVRKGTDGIHRPDGIRVTVTANMSGRNESNREGRGMILYSTKEGATVIGWVFIDATYTQPGERRIAGR